VPLAHHCVEFGNRWFRAIYIGSIYFYHLHTLRQRSVHVYEYLYFVYKLQVSMVFYGSGYCITSVASCYLFARVKDRKHLQKSASIAAVGLELENFFGDVSGQIIISSNGGNYTALPYCNLFG